MAKGYFHPPSRMQATKNTLRTIFTKTGWSSREIKAVRHGRFILLPISSDTRGHGTHTLAAVWQEHLRELLAESLRDLTVPNV